MVALLGFHDAEILEDLVAMRVDEEPSARLLGQILKGSETVRELARTAVHDGVDGGARALAHIDGLAKKYLGKDVHPWHDAKDVRMIYEIEPLSVQTMG